MHSLLQGKPVACAGLLIAAGLMAVPAAHGFRCGNQLIEEGDRKYDVVEKCGEPDYRDRRAGVFLEGIGPIGATEIWYYNEGPTRLLRVLTFRRGRLRSVETGGRGFNENLVKDACDPYQLDIGMSKYELLNRCGEPVARNSWLEYAGSRFHRRHHLHGTVLVEEWIYTFGSNRFRRYIRIINGRVVGIARGDKGG